MSEPIRLWRVWVDGYHYTDDPEIAAKACDEELAALPRAAFDALTARVAKLEAEQSEARNRAARLEAALRDAADALDDAERGLRDAADELEDDAAAIDAHVEADAAEQAASEARAALEEPCKGDSPEAAEEDKP